MVDLDQFPEDTYRTLIALPYRIGLYISMSDKTGGKASEAQELSALENVVTFYVEDTLKSEFSQTIMLATLQHKAYWPEWGLEIEQVPAECEYIVGYLADRVEDRVLAGFKNNLLEIAMAVALAYRETSQPTGMAKFKNLFRTAKLPAAEEESAYLNISVDEKAAINKLSDMLGVTHKVA